MLQFFKNVGSKGPKRNFHLESINSICSVARTELFGDRPYIFPSFSPSLLSYAISQTAYTILEIMKKKLRANFSLKLSKQKSVTIFLNVGSKGFLLFRTLTIKAILCYTRKTPVREFSVSLLFSKHFRDFRTVVSTHQPCNEARCAVAVTLTPPIPLFAYAILFLRF